MSDFVVFVVGGFSFLFALEFAELKFGYSLSDKIKDVFQSEEKRVASLKAKAGKFLLKADALVKKVR